MSMIELLLLAVGLSMDACAVAVCKGLAMRKVSLKNCCIVGIWFGGFQALMPFVGYLLGSAFEKYITAFDHWLAFILLGFIGANMIKEAFSAEEADASLQPRMMFTLAIATSIDALAVGIPFAALLHSFGQVVFACVAIGVITFILSACGVKIGNLFGSKWRTGASLTGGIILILLGVKILLEHLGVLHF